MSIGYYIGVSGPMGSGKTTLSKKVATILNLDYVPKRLGSKKYLPDLFASTKRWALEAQISFLIEKSRLLKNAMSFGGAIVDRTLDEDVNVFAKYFYDKGFIDERGYSLYKDLSSHYFDDVCNPEYIIYCSCDIEILKQRIYEKGREFQMAYPEGHLEDIYNYYKVWYEEYDKSALYVIDSEAVNFHDAGFDRLLKADIECINARSTLQMDLFDVSKETELRVIKEVRPYIKRTGLALDSGKKSQEIIKYPYAYIAAPFTSLTISHKDGRVLNLFDDIDAYGEIKKDNKLRVVLEGIVKEMKKKGINTLLPHKDINDWGRKKVSPKKVYEDCVYYVHNCDIFIGILGMSQGVHLEYGYAISQKKPCILIQCEEVESSYISKGISENQDNTVVLRVPNFEGIVTSIAQINFNKLLDSLL